MAAANPSDLNSAEECNRLGNTLQEQGHLAEAIAYYQRGLELRPGAGLLLYNLGRALLVQGQVPESIACFEQALAHEPNDVLTLNNLGIALRDVGRLDEAIVRLERAAALSPQSTQILCNLATSLNEQGRYSEAIDRARQALVLQPDDVEALNGLGLALFGLALRDRGDLNEAIGCFQRAIAVRPDYPEAHTNLGLALQEQSRLNDAIDSLQRAVQLRPNDAAVHNNLGCAWWALGELDQALACYRRAVELNPGFVAAHSNLLYSLYFSPKYDARAIYDEHVRFDERHAAPLTNLVQPHANDRSPDRRLRVGYVSPNFREHAEAFFFVPLLESHDHQQVEVFCYSDVGAADSTTMRIQRVADHWRQIVGQTDEQVAEIIRGDQIDILMDLTMHMGGGRPLLFARQPAPVQVCWLAYQGTTGLRAVQYRLTDSICDPPGLDDRFYTEESIRLPDSFGCYDPLTREPAVNRLPASQQGFVTFGSLNNFCKVNESVLKLWARVLQAVERSRLLLLAAPGPPRERALRVMGHEGIAPDRIAFADFVPRRNYLEQYHQIDIGLDTLPYNGQTTTLDAAWMGVPTITLVGQTAVGRAGASLLRNLGLPELVAESPNQFVQIATDLARDLPRLTQLRATLRQRLQQSPLMDGPCFARKIEAAYRQMWQRWAAKPS